MARIIVDGGIDNNPPVPRPPSQPGTSGGNPTTTRGGVPGLLTSSGGIIGSNSFLLVPFFNNGTNTFSFAIYDATNFNCEEDCSYDFKMEDVVLGRNVDIHKVYMQYRDLGPVSFKVTVTAVQLNRVTGKETVNAKFKKINISGVNDQKIHSLFIDLKTVGERPQLNIFRAKNAGPLSIVAAMMVGNMAEEEQL